MPPTHIGVLVFAIIAATGAENLPCIHESKRTVSVVIGDEEPKKVMTLIQGDPGYRKNMQCEWVLTAENYDVPRQMYINVPVVDFDTNNATEAQCNSSSVDVFKVLMKLDESSFRNESWCSNGAVKVRTQIVNLWDSSYNLTSVFVSDGKQVRNNSKGVQMDVWVLGRDYCHAHMLYLDGKCYLITPENVTLTEAFQLAKNYLGNVFTGPSNEDFSVFLSRFFKTNSDRRNLLPLTMPLNLAGAKMWTGFFASSRDEPSAVQIASFLEPSKDCQPMKRRLTLLLSETSLLINGGACFS